MTFKKLHYLSGLVISLFIAFHLFNHLWSIVGIGHSIELMRVLRNVYRNVLAETLLMAAVLIQIVSGLTLFKASQSHDNTFFEKLQRWTGLYLAVFLVFHVSAVFIGRHLLKLDTNFYFGAAGLNSFPTCLFFVPYYSFTVLAFFGHVASIHQQKMSTPVWGLSPSRQAKLILTAGFGLAFLLLYGQTNHFQGIDLPKEYEILTGK